jgi:hypothetical protein
MVTARDEASPPPHAQVSQLMWGFMPPRRRDGRQYRWVDHEAKLAAKRRGGGSNQ